MTYFDIYGPASPAELLKMKNWAVANGVQYEDMLLHAKVDYTSAINPAWSRMDKFDNFEGFNGILRTADEVAYTDLTSTAYSSNVTWQNTMYVGYEEAFDQINLTLSSPGSGVTRTWEYWDGSAWSALTVNDGTTSFTVNGRVSFVPPANWARRQVNASRSKYFVRCRISSASSSPVTNSVKGDDWLRGANNLCRGWAGTDSGVVNTGELKYNPTPPAGAAAKFPYQSRITYWSINHFAANPADFQSMSGVAARTWAKYVAYHIITTVSATGHDGVMCDDGEKNVASDGIASTSTDFVDRTTNTWQVESENKYGDIVTEVRLLDPSIKVGINAQNKTYVRQGDWSLAEYHTFNWKTGSPAGIVASVAVPVMAYDDYLPANNTSGIVGVLIYQDTSDVVVGKTAVWDRGHRGPLVALSKHYIGANNNTVFSYYSRGGYIYSETDEVYIKDGSVRHQATDAVPSVDLVKRWGTYFPAMGVDIGIADAAGHNGGVRDLAWKSHTEIGGVQDVWRRDFTKAIVLHRPASWNTTDDEYNNHSSPMSLSGTYYPLMADGTLGAGVTSVSLRSGEGAILMKSDH